MIHIFHATKPHLMGIDIERCYGQNIFLKIYRPRARAPARPRARAEAPARPPGKSKKIKNRENT